MYLTWLDPSNAKKKVFGSEWVEGENQIYCIALWPSDPHLIFTWPGPGLELDKRGNMSDISEWWLWIICEERSSQEAPVSWMMMSLTLGGRGVRSGGEMTSSAQPTGNTGLWLVNTDLNTGLWLVKTDHVTIILASDWSTNSAQLTGAVEKIGHLKIRELTKIGAV